MKNCESYRDKMVFGAGNAVNADKFFSYMNHCVFNKPVLPKPGQPEVEVQC